MPLTPSAEITEVAVISDSGSRSANCAIYDLKTQSVLATFKEGHSVPKGLCFIGYDHLISAFDDRAILKVWKVSNKNLEEDKMTTSGKVSCLTVTDCGLYCAAGIGKSIYVWEVETGELQHMFDHHSQTVTNLKYTNDGSYLISGGKDGLALVWSFSKILNSGEKMPCYTWMDHAGEITDIHVGCAGQYARVVTSSSDMTCRIYELETGNLLTTIKTDYSITAVTMDSTECFLILGSCDGKLFRINLWAVRDGSLIASESDEGISGHGGAITCLSISMFGKYLLTGSDDGSCKIWDLHSFTCLKNLPFEGRITNAFISLLPPGLRTEGHYETRLTVSTFKRVPDYTISCITAKVHDKKLSTIHLGSTDEYFLPGVLNHTEKFDYISKSRISMESMETINKQLYSYALTDSMSAIYEE